MMTIKINWERVKKLKEDMIAAGFKDDDILNLIVAFDNENVRKMSVFHKDLMRFFWTISEAKRENLSAFIIQDKSGRIWYRHSYNEDKEQIPVGGNPEVVLKWNSLDDITKQTHLKLLISKLSSYDE